MSISRSQAWKKLKAHAKEISKTHLRDLMFDGRRCKAMSSEAEGIVLDYSRQNATTETTKLLLDLAKEADLKNKIKAMVSGKRINVTEDRAVLHTALRAPKGSTVKVDGKNVMPDVHDALAKIKDISKRVRNGSWVGATGKPLTDVVAIGIGGSYLGPEFVAESLRTDKGCARAAEGRRLRFFGECRPH